jgi:hypothetical protein
MNKIPNGFYTVTVCFTGTSRVSARKNAALYAIEVAPSQGYGAYNYCP